jgi:hypothetical protein
VYITERALYVRHFSCDYNNAVSCVREEHIRCADPDTNMTRSTDLGDSGSVLPNKLSRLTVRNQQFHHVWSDRITEWLWKGPRTAFGRVTHIFGYLKFFSAVLENHIMKSP